MEWRDPIEREAYVLGTAGLIKGIYEVFIKPELTVERLAFAGGLALGAVVMNRLSTPE